MFGLLSPPRCRHACADAEAWGPVSCGLATELAGTYVFLASADSRYMTGEIIAITGKSTSR